MNTLVNRNIFVKTILFVIGILFVLVGIILLFMPGPGALFLFLGGLLLCVISRKLARFFDALEVNGVDIVKRYRK